MRLLCMSCNYVFDDDFWDKQEGIAPWVRPEKCPVCDDYDSFQWVTEQVNYIKDDTSDMMELDHFPEIIINSDNLEVQIWKESHPMWPEHRILSIALHDEYGDLIEKKYLIDQDESKISFDFDDLDEFEIRVKCSVHWLWWKKFKN